MRRATTRDLDAICTVERGEEGPWGEMESCDPMVRRNLARGYYIQIAYRGGEPVGHGEWNVSDEPSGRAFYLNLLQVRKGFQKMGVGTRMMEDGAREANLCGCARLTTMPDLDTGSDAFYRKNGFVKSRSLFQLSAKARDTGAKIARIDAIPESVIAKKRFISGYLQASSRFMWELITHPPNKERIVHRARVPGGYIVLMHFPGKRADALAWGDMSAGDALSGCMQLAHECGIGRFSFVFDGADCADVSACAAGEISLHDSYEMVKLLG
ncbi:MAG: GNAT family N-acetyltransferase [Christensenellales bacterium]